MDGWRSSSAGDRVLVEGTSMLLSESAMIGSMDDALHARKHGPLLYCSLLAVFLLHSLSRDCGVGEYYDVPHFVDCRVYNFIFTRRLEFAT